MIGLKKLSEFIEFGVNLDEALRYQIFWELKYNNIKKRLLFENVENFKICVELSTSLA